MAMRLASTSRVALSIIACMILISISTATDYGKPTTIVNCETTKGPLKIEVHRSWAPLGADRFVELVKDGFYTNIAFFRCVKRFLTQFGISENPAMKHWHNNNIPDDPNLHMGIQKNFLSFAGGGPNTRSTQLFIAFEYLDFLGKEPWETPFGVVVEGQKTLDDLYKGYGDIPPFGKGPNQQKIHNRGNAYIHEEFPQIDFLLSCAIEEDNNAPIQPLSVPESAVLMPPESVSQTTNTVHNNAAVATSSSDSNTKDQPSSIVNCETTKGPLKIEIHRSWAPLGADRFVELVKDGFYTNIAFFRCVERFLTQFGISDNPTKRHWHNKNIKDDPNLHMGIQKNFLSFAGGGPNTRSTQLFIAFEYLDFLGKAPWETPFGVVVEGQKTLDDLYKGYGDIPPYGKGPDQTKLHNRGNAYIHEEFPQIDFLLSCAIEEPINQLQPVMTSSNDNVSPPIERLSIPEAIQTTEDKTVMEISSNDNKAVDTAATPEDNAVITERDNSPPKPILSNQQKANAGMEEDQNNNNNVLENQKQWNLDTNEASSNNRGEFGRKRRREPQVIDLGFQSISVDKLSPQAHREEALSRRKRIGNNDNEILKNNKLSVDNSITTEEMADNKRIDDDSEEEDSVTFYEALGLLVLLLFVLYYYIRYAVVMEKTASASSAKAQ